MCGLGVYGVSGEGEIVQLSQGAIENTHFAVQHGTREKFLTIIKKHHADRQCFLQFLSSLPLFSTEASAVECVS